MITPEDRAEKWLRTYEEGIEDPARNTEAIKQAWKLYRDGDTPAQLKEQIATALDYMIGKL